MSSITTSITSTNTDTPETDTTLLPLPEPILTLSNNITIRPYHPSDPPFLAQHANNRKIWQNLQNRFPHPYKPENAAWWISRCGSLPTTNDILPTITSNITDTSTTLNDKDNDNDKTTPPTFPSDYALCHHNKPIGCIGLDRSTMHPHTASLGYWLGETYWGRGVISEAASAFLAWSFATFPWLVRVQADAYSWNPASMRILEKIGMSREGVLKGAVCKGGRWGDLVLFGVVREGWEGRRENVPENWV